MGKITWPEIFLTGKEPEEYKNMTPDNRLGILCADGLCGWAICKSGMADKIPEKFGEGMAHIGTVLGVCTSDALMEYSKKIMPKLTKHIEQ